MKRRAAVLALLLAAGCKDSGTINEDARFLRAMDTPPPAQSVDLASLFPARPGIRWSALFQSPGGTERTETTRFVGMRTLGKRTCAVFETNNQGRNAYRTEWYEIRPEGIYLAQAGGNDRIALNPPFLVLPNPLEPEREHQWEGIMTFRGVAMQARGITRFRGRSSLTLPIGTVDAYRVETVLLAMVDGRTIRFPTTRWFAPKYGAVRTWFQVDRNEFQRDMVRWYSPPEKEKTTSNTGGTR